MDDKIYEKLNEIKDLNDRALLKKIMNSVFESLEEYSREKLNDIEKRVFNELNYVKEKYNIYSTMVKLENFDETDEFLFPIIQEDIEEKVYDTKEILKALNNNKNIKIFKIFLKCDYLIFEEFISKNFDIKGTIETNKKIHKANFKVVKNTQYIDKVRNLYKSFINSNITWTTINNPYIHKIADVILVGCEDKIENDEKVIEIKVDFGAYNNSVEHKMIPIWNVNELSLKCDGFPVPFEDKVNFEHSIQIPKEEQKNGYLVDYENDDIEWITFTRKAVNISSNISVTKFWKILNIVSLNKNKNKKYDYDLMSNEVNVNFTNKLAFEKSYTIKTKTELARFINSYEVSRYLTFKEVKLMEKYPDEFKQSYEVNDFIIDEIREENIKRLLILYFEPVNKENYLNRDVLSFLVSEVQLLYPEYKCEGRFV